MIFSDNIHSMQDFSMQPPAQELIAKDLHDNEWKFRHIFRGGCSFLDSFSLSPTLSLVIYYNLESCSFHVVVPYYYSLSPMFLISLCRPA